MESIFHQLRGKLKLPTHHREALIDFVATLPDIWSKAMTTRVVHMGTEENGMIDKGALRSPDFYQMIKGTTRRTVTNEEMDNLLCRDVEFANYIAASIGSDIRYPKENSATPSKFVSHTGLLH